MVGGDFQEEEEGNVGTERERRGERREERGERREERAERGNDKEGLAHLLRSTMANHAFGSLSMDGTVSTPLKSWTEVD